MEGRAGSQRPGLPARSISVELALPPTRTVVSPLGQNSNRTWPLPALKTLGPAGVCCRGSGPLSRALPPRGRGASGSWSAGGWWALPRGSTLLPLTGRACVRATRTRVRGQRVQGAVPAPPLVSTPPPPLSEIGASRPDLLSCPPEPLTCRHSPEALLVPLLSQLPPSHPGLEAGSFLQLALTEPMQGEFRPHRRLGAVLPEPAPPSPSLPAAALKVPITSFQALPPAAAPRHSGWGPDATPQALWELGPAHLGHPPC